MHIWFSWVHLILARYIWYFDKLETSDYDSQSFNIFTGLLMTPHWSKHFHLSYWIRASQLSLLFWSAPGLLMIPHHWPKQQKLSPAKSSISSTGEREIFKIKCSHNVQDITLTPIFVACSGPGTFHTCTKWAAPYIW